MGETLENLLDLYQENPTVKSLVELLNLGGFPIGSVIDGLLGKYITEYKEKKIKIFFQQNTGEAVLSPDVIENQEFLHAYFSTVNYVLRTRSDEKIERFAKILKHLYKGEINIDQFEDYTAIFNELTDREFAILMIKFKYEEKFADKDEVFRMKNMSSYWDDFKLEVCNKIGITTEELNPMLLRIQRTGCYRKPDNYLGASSDQCGLTTELFNRIYQMVK
ncbi:hypothetical protein WG906_14910 [Pedobacter sp. P351]|uniref:hypothetical protein n=1 Tax=Pedobacter superstes TaxID=3133441 RepID=UPI0030B12B59